MTTENEIPQLSDLMVQAIEQNPVSFKEIFDQIMQQKAADVLAQAKAEVAQNYFYTTAEEEPEQVADEQHTEDEPTETEQPNEVEQDGQDTETV